MKFYLKDAEYLTEIILRVACDDTAHLKVYSESEHSDSLGYAVSLYARLNGVDDCFICNVASGTHEEMEDLKMRMDFQVAVAIKDTVEFSKRLLNLGGDSDA